MKYLHADLISYRGTLLHRLKKDYERLPSSSRSRIIAKSQYDQYRIEGRVGEKLNEAVDKIECKQCLTALQDVDVKGLCHLNCAYSKCDKCPAYKESLIESRIKNTDETKVPFHEYTKVWCCSEHSYLPVGIDVCERCDQNHAEGKKIPKLTCHNKLIKKNLLLQDFLKNKYMKALKKSKRHRFQYKVLSNNMTLGDRKEIISNEVWTLQDFVERLKLEFNQQAQHECFGGSVTISIEGYVTNFYKKGATKTTMEFHTFFSDGKRQDSAVVLNHMEKLIKKLKKDGALKDGSYLYSQSGGAVSQYHSSSASACDDISVGGPLPLSASMGGSLP